MRLDEFDTPSGESDRSNLLSILLVQRFHTSFDPNKHIKFRNSTSFSSSYGDDEITSYCCKVEGILLERRKRVEAVTMIPYLSIKENNKREMIDEMHFFGCARSAMALKNPKASVDRAAHRLPSEPLRTRNAKRPGACRFDRVDSKFVRIRKTRAQLAQAAIQTGSTA